MAIIHEIPAPGDTLDDLMARARRATLTERLIYPLVHY